MGSGDLSNEENIKHLEFLQSTISRLTTNSFLMKGWALTVVSAILGFAVNAASRGMSLVALATIASFWVLDAYLLRHERLFRRLYDAVSKRDTTVPRFSMSTARFAATEKLRRILFRPILSVFYCTLLTVTIVVAVIAPQLGKLR
jgi:hypothetical protein